MYALWTRHYYRKRINGRRRWFASKWKCSYTGECVSVERTMADLSRIDSWGHSRVILPLGEFPDPPHVEHGHELGGES